MAVDALAKLTDLHGQDHFPRLDKDLDINTK